MGAGQEYCTSLTCLVLVRNEISVISPLANLTSLTELFLWVNQISDISPLANLTNLTELFLQGNNLDLRYNSDDMANIRALEARGVKVFHDMSR